ncbi:hypothetical protein DOTSEDRAFT_145504 [Dothistroma septosporum NZE10]|uniref:Carboxylic ester hydrolase n=1 Tax=Dothistroma septosporum (strain NZE10 / CBS 128990) TaxID=675120 RepID=N1PW13_DOTSN|nr:hypothetical protein DOTSEDRAFT_145504 [Dothistroma septosporum NZE10]
MPFAQSPPERFSPPQKQGVGSCNIDATAWKPACIQQFVYPKIAQEFVEAVFNSPAPEESEDCLYLNVYAPSSPAPEGGRAVMFWIYGGALQFGNAGQTYYDGSSFAAYEDVIVVTSNYRTNVFGFATSPELPIAEQNLGFLDQRAGLDWVQRNIAAFGGSPHKVTIFGESAGGFSVDALLTSFPKNSTPPFRGAIMESGQYSYSAQPRTSTVPIWNQLAGLLNCTTSYTSNLTCLRAANASTIKNAIEVHILEFNPVADNVTLVHNPMQQRLSGNIAHVPILGGSNAQEGRVFTVGQTNSTTYLRTILGNNTAAITALESAYSPYHASNGTEAYTQVSEIVTESVFQCPAAYQANATASIGIPAWRYYFNASFSNTQAYSNLGVYHASEIPIVFSTYPRVNVTAQEYALSRAMRGMWATFAKNPAGGPGWNPVGSGKPGTVLVGAMSEAEGGLIMNGNETFYGAYNVGLLGNRGDALSSGVTVIDGSEIDYRCGLYAATYNGFANIDPA